MYYVIPSASTYYKMMKCLKPPFNDLKMWEVRLKKRILKYLLLCLELLLLSCSMFISMVVRIINAFSCLIEFYTS
jgi:hypothetical protein